MSQVTLPSPPRSPLNFWVTLASVSFAPGPSSVIVFSSQPPISTVPLAERFISLPPCHRRTRPYLKLDIDGAGGGNRTRTSTLEGSHATTTPHPHARDRATTA